jgi:nicotinamidase/pyrazinamidase
MSALILNQSTDVLLVIDMQTDHVSGSLAHPGAPALIEPINRLAEKFDHVIVVKDWHPADHISFVTSHEGYDETQTFSASYGQQFLGPPHCVQGTPGAELAQGFRLQKAELEFFKGYRRDVDSFSAFHMNDETGTGLAELLRARGFKRVFGTGVGRYGCVGRTLKGATREGFEAWLVMDCSAQNWRHRATTEQQIQTKNKEAEEDLNDHGVHLIESKNIDR